MSLEHNRAMIKALIVEDNRDFRDSLKAILHSQFPDIVVAEAETADEALRALGLFRPQLAFIDIHLPGAMNGLQLVARIRAADREMHIVMITSHDLPEYRSASAAMGANHFLSKSAATRADILAVIRSVTPR